MPRTGNTEPYKLTNSWIEKSLLKLLNGEENNPAIVGELRRGAIHMPFGDVKKPKKGTWVGKLVKLAKDIVNAPSSTRHCWLVGTGENQATFRVGNKTSGPGNYRTHRVLFYLSGPASREKLGLLTKEAGDKLPDGLLLRHRCGNGYNAGVSVRVKGSILPRLKSRVCVNPWCLQIGTYAENSDDRGCRYGSRALCPHRKRCRFNDPVTGRPIPCLQSKKRVPKCRCTPKCYPRAKNVPNAG